MSDWYKAYTNQLSYFLPHIQDYAIRSIFFGGGTPSLMSPELIDNLLKWLKDHLDIRDTTEITLEANPSSVEASKFEQFRQSGINRLSMGIQSLHDEVLSFLGRKHNASQARAAIQLAQQLFDNYSFDLIYARPHQSWSQWSDELQEALFMAKGHLSLYQLTIEKGTPFFDAVRAKQFVMPDEEHAALLYERTNELMKSQGLESYEISNYAKPGFECQHNLQYWEYKPYLGIGPGAHSRLSIDNNWHALIMHHNPDKWLNTTENNHAAIQQDVILSQEEQKAELLTMHLRLQDGISLRRLSSAGIDLKDIPQYLFDEDFIHITNTQLSITPKGRLLTNRIIKTIVQALSR